MYCLIFSFSHENGLHGSGGLPVANRFDTFGFLSKDCYQCCIRYVQQKPILAEGICGLLLLAVIAFMCRHKVKLESMQLDFRSSLGVSLSIQLLRRCDLTELRSITVVNSSQDHPHDNSSDGSIAAAIAAGIPREAFEQYHPISPSQAALQEIIADILVEQAPLLTEMNVRLFRLLHLPLLNGFSNQLEELTRLSIYLIEENDEDAMDISLMIENMHKLKKTLVLRRGKLFCQIAIVRRECKPQYVLRE